jgi:hypothetical protein
MSVYQIPPPPRPVESTVAAFVKAPYLDMSGSGSGSATPTEAPTSPTTAKASQTSQKNGALPKGESPQYHEIKSPPQTADPFGTMRASNNNRARSIEAQTDDDDVFLPTATIAKDDPFGTLRANRAMGMFNNNNECTPARQQQQQLDYRGEQEEKNSRNGGAGYENELAITNELLYLLEEFKNKSYTVKEMEVMFDKWRRKAAIYDFPDKSKVKLVNRVAQQRL